MPPRKVVVVLLFSMVAAMMSSCGWRTMAVERHRQSMKMREQAIELRELELQKLRKAQ
ncbi:MAG: hypothetical protein ABFD60_07895 [Bryobacteraceae bacterium]